MTNKENKYAGSVPDTYHDYLVPLLFDAYAKDLAERVNVPVGGAVLKRLAVPACLPGICWMLCLTMPG